MSITLRPSDALSPEAFYSLYLGGLVPEDESVRLETSYALLSLGRLGMAPDELLHLHEGWVDWELGEIHVPAHDPCGCEECWEHARLRQRQGDSRDLEAIVAGECWTPPDGSGPRRLPFGWSQRLCAATGRVVETGVHYGSTHTTVLERIETAAANARHIDPDAVSVPALRASALVFLASAGFGPRRLADLTGVDERTAGEFARVGGGEVRDHLYRVLADVPEPTLCAGETDYRLVCDPDGFTREPFDPTRYDAEWRQGRAEESTGRERNPRPLAPPERVSFGPDDLPAPREPSADSGPGIVAESLEDWVTQREQERGGGHSDAGTARTEAGGTPESRESEGTGPTATDDGPPEITGPTEFSIDTRLVAPGFENGRPTGGSILLGQEKLVFLSRDASGQSDTLEVELDWIANLAPGYVPDPLEGIFEDTVGIAYRDENDERSVVVVEVPSDARWQFIQTIFAKILDGESALVTHRANEPTAVGPEEREMDAATDALELAHADEEKTAIRIRLKLVLENEKGRMTAEDGYKYGVKVQHLARNGQPVVTELRALEESTEAILTRYLDHYDNRYANRVRTTPLGDVEMEILESLYETAGGRDLTAMLDKDRETLSDAIQHLSELGLVIDGRNGKRLTGVGYRLISPEYEL